MVEGVGGKWDRFIAVTADFYRGFLALTGRAEG